jgi:hypothetical protein
MNQRSTVQHAFKTNQRSSGNTVAFLITVYARVARLYTVYRIYMYLKRLCYVTQQSLLPTNYSNKS